jgi:hypothetical protein
MKIKVIVIVDGKEITVNSLEELNGVIKQPDPSVPVSIEFHEFGTTPDGSAYEGVVSATVDP